MVLFDLHKQYRGIILEDSVTAEAAAELTGYNVQHIRRLALARKLEAVHIGRSWLIKVKLLEAYLNEVVLLIHPLVLGSGRHLFTDGGISASLRLVDTRATTTGVVIATYQPAAPTARKTT